MSDAALENEGAIRVEQLNYTRLITIDRPRKLNAFTPAMLWDLTYAFRDAENDDNCRCIILAAEGKHFTAGLDLVKVAEHYKAGKTLFPVDSIDVFDLRPPFRSKPLIMAVKGICFTIGLELMLAADLVVAADDCRFSQMEVKRGLLATGGSTIRMVQRAGWSNAMRYLLTGDEFDANTALRLNFLQEVVPTGEELARSKEFAVRIAEHSAPKAVEFTRASARMALDQGASASVIAFDNMRARLRAMDDADEGVRSFLEKRPPRFTGR